MEEEIVQKTQDKNWLTTFLFCLFLGNFGIHRFYTGKVASGIFQILTAGGLGIWSLIDLILIASEKFKDSKGNYIKSEKKNLNVALVFVVLMAVINILILARDIPIISRSFEKMDNTINSTLDKYDFEDTTTATMEIFIKMDSTEDEIYKLGNELKKIKGVKTVEFKSKDEALEEYKKGLGDKGNILDKYKEDNFFPDSYVITFNNLKDAPIIEREINKLDNVKKVSSGYAAKEQHEYIKTYTSMVYAIAKIIIIISVVIEIIKTILLVIATIFVNKLRSNNQEQLN